MGLAAIILAAQPQIALAVSSPGTTQVELSAVVSAHRTSCVLESYSTCHLSSSDALTCAFRGTS